MGWSTGIQDDMYGHVGGCSVGHTQGCLLHRISLTQHLLVNPSLHPPPARWWLVLFTLLRKFLCIRHHPHQKSGGEQKKRHFQANQTAERMQDSLSCQEVAGCCSLALGSDMDWAQRDWGTRIGKSNVEKGGLLRKGKE